MKKFCPGLFLLAIAINNTASGQVFNLVKDINTNHNPASSTPYSYSPHKLTAIGSVVYFNAGSLTTGFELWKSDGTTSGTVVVKDIWAGIGDGYPRYLANVNGTLFFGANFG